MSKEDFVKWPSIESFKSVHKWASKRLELGEVTYRTKVKLHGTNGAVTLKPDMSVLAQSRNRILSEEYDNHGFYKFVKENFTPIARNPNTNTTFFGEFYGKGIMENTAASEVEDKHFAVFAMYEDDKWITEPWVIDLYLCTCFHLTDKVVVLPYESDFYYNVVFYDSGSVGRFTNGVNQKTLYVEKEDPFIKSIHGISGTGEGLVYYPYTKDEVFHTDLMFKAKGEAHRVNKSKNAAEVDTTHTNPTVLAFLDEVCTEARYKQAVEECGITEFEKKHIGPFLKWVVNDIRKDAENGNVTYPEDVKESKVNSAINTKARIWYMEKENGL